MAIGRTERKALLEERRALKMARSVHAYVRGNTAKFYEWLAASPIAKDIPEGPSIWICGDCHLGNLGPVADADHRIEVQIRDLDQTVIGNPALDLIRLGLSLETAARSSDLPGVTTAKMIEAMIDGYLRAMTVRTTDDPPEPNVVRSVRTLAVGRRWKHLARERIGDVDPELPIGKRFWKLTGGERAAVEALFRQPDISTRTLELAGLGPKSSLRVIDAANWRKGCSSLGRLRYAVVIGVTGGKSGHEYFALVDIKEAVASVAPFKSDVAMPADPADRVVAGARALAPNLGERMIAACLFDRPVVLRELAPQDLKIEVEQFSRKEAVAAAQYLAFVVGVGHARQLSDEQRTAWGKTLTRHRAANLDAPSWLWRSIVDLAATHEAGYLEHCRRYAMSTA
ncbi:DUF2252 domain-containing protein [soil metagenome]